MADNPNLPGGAVPPKPAESSKIQPKKETVRISLPPKPTASATIKLPTLPPPGGATAPTAVAAVVAVPTPAPAAYAPVPPTGAPAVRVASASAPQRAAAATGAPAAAPLRPLAHAARGVSGLDKGLAIGAGVAALVAAGSTVFILMMLSKGLGE